MMDVQLSASYCTANSGTDEEIVNEDEVNVSSVYEDMLSQNESDDSEENSSDDEQEVCSFQRTEESTRLRENNRLILKKLA